MRAALLSLMSLSTAVARGVGLEGLLILFGTAALSIAASFFSPAGPWLVWGIVGLTLGFAVAWRAA